MPVVTATQFKTLILMEVGEPLSGGPLTGAIEVLWDMYSDKALIAPRLQYLYVKAKAIDVKIGSIADGANMPVGLTQEKTLDDKVSTWVKQRDAALVEAAKIERAYAQVRTPVTGTLTTTAPIGPADDNRTIGALDANDRPYRGDAYLNIVPTPGRII